MESLKKLAELDLTYEKTINKTSEESSPLSKVKVFGKEEMTKAALKPP